MNNGLSEKSRSGISDGLYRYLADMYCTYLMTQNFHWNVTGKEFFSLHLLFEKQYAELAEALDEVAERIRSLGFYVDATFTGFKSATPITEESKVLNAKDMLEKLISAHEILIKHIRHVCDLAEKDHDGGTVDLLGRRMGVHEKMVWMLRSQL